MCKIRIMDEVLANKIAAGEVVEKCMNVVKELVENAIDAKADDIRIDLTDSGVKMIRVIDNGIGMNKEDACLAFSRHATSKLITEDDLFNINSLGFRGEALPSIASVSQVEVKTSDGANGTIVNIDGGKIIDVSSSDLRKGTSITVSNLFYNTPVRLKYLKNLYTELAYITEYVNKMALSYPNIKFTLTNNDKILLNTDGSDNLLKVINNIYGLQITKKMIEINGENDDYEVSGFISYPEVVKSNKNAITTLVNGRIIKNNELNKAIIDSYHTYIAVDKYPIIVLKIEVDPSLIDINIHPTKMDIKFSKMDTLKQLVTDMITMQLTKLTLIPEIKKEEFVSKEEEVKLFNDYVKMQNEIINSPKEVKQERLFEKQQLDFTYQVNENNETYQKEGQVFLENELTDNIEEEIISPRIKKMFPVGLVHGTYIIAENEDAMFIIDQHAANERINYEKYLKELGKDTNVLSDLLIPITIELPSNEYIILKENFEKLEELGISYEEFGINTLVIRSVPIWLPSSHLEEAIRRIIDIIVNTEKFSKEKYIEKIAITLACKMSIKANDHIELASQEILLDRLSKCENPFTCPHGRPTIITYQKYDLEKLFKRAAD